MKVRRSTVLFAVAAFALAGWFLPSVWLPGGPEPARSRIPLQRPETVVAWKALAGRINAAGSAMQQFQAVAANVAGSDRSLVDTSGPLTGLNCEEAEELALRLAGSDLGLNVRNGAEFIRSLKSLPFRVQAAALAAWAEHDPDAALRTLFTPDGLNLASSVETGLLRRLAEHDPDKAAQILRTGAPYQTTSGWAAVIGVLAHKDTALALNALETIPFAARKTAMAAIVSELSDKDPPAALEWTKTLSADQRKLVSWENLFYKWGETDPAAAAAAWETTDKEGMKQNWNLAQQWAAKDPEGGIRWASESKACPQPDYFASVSMQAMAEKDPQKALATLATLKESLRQGSIRAIASAWGSSDFPAALAWARTLTAPAEKDTVLTSLAAQAGQISESDRRALVEEAGAQSATAFQILWHTDRDEAMRTFASLPAAKQQEAWQRLSGTIYRESPAELAHVMDLMAQKGGAPAASNSDSYALVPRMVSTWAQSDPAAAGAWVSKLSPNETQSWAANNLVAAWSRNDLEAAAAWTQSLPEGPAKDKALYQLINTAGGAGDPATAIKWGASIKDASQRQQVLQNYFSVLSRTGAAAAQAAIETLNIEPGEKAAILGTVKK